MIVAITGTPGTGKTSVCELLSAEGLLVVSLNDLLEENHLLELPSIEGSARLVEVSDIVNLELFESENQDLIVEGHLSHHINSDIVVILRCRPNILAHRLETRGYSREKIVENVLAEALDVILIEASDMGKRVYEIDCSEISLQDAMESVKDIINGNVDDYLPGKIDWSEEVLRWA